MAFAPYSNTAGMILMAFISISARCYSSNRANREAQAAFKDLRLKLA
jgi:hypothetical protein